MIPGMEATLTFWVSDYVARPFSEVAGRIVTAVAEALADATERLGVGASLSGQIGAPYIGAWRLMELPVRWWTPAGSLAVDGAFRVLPVQDGRDAMTELLFRGTFSDAGLHDVQPLAWARETVELVCVYLASAIGQGKLSSV